MPRRLAQQRRMTLSDLEWPFHASRAISAPSAVAELLVGLVSAMTPFFVRASADTV